MGYFDYVAATVTILLITLIPATSTYYIYYSWLTQTSRLPLLAPFALSVLSIHFNYFSAMFRSPGHVPLSYQQPDDAQIVSLKKSDLKARYCRRCMCGKPPRAHHCSDCNKCILKMDHHCPWVANCVGYNNYPYFYRFLVSVTIATSYGLMLLATRLYELIKLSKSHAASYYGEDAVIYFTPMAGHHELVALVVDAMAMFLVLLCVGVLTIYQTQFILTNTTTIESFENDKISDMLRRGQIEELSPYPYDLGWRGNLAQVYGAKWWMWAWSGTPGDGLDYVVNEESVEWAGGDCICWPPTAYLEYKTSGGHCSGDSVRRGKEGYVVSRKWELDDDDDLGSGGSEEDIPLAELRRRIKANKE